MRGAATSVNRNGGRADRLWFTAVGIFLFALSVRLAFLVWQGPLLTATDEEYALLARNLLAHGVFSVDPVAPFRPYTHHPPLYPAFLAVLGWFGGLSRVGVAVAQAVLDAGVAVLVFFLAREVAGRRWALGAALAYGVHLGAIGSTLMMMSETVFTALLVGAVAALALGQRQDRPGLTALGGVGLGLAALCRPIALPLPFLFLGARFLAPRLPRPRLHGFLLVAGLLVVVTPWVVRSSRAAHQFVLIQTGLGESVYVGLPGDWWRKGTFWSEWQTTPLSAAPEKHAEMDRLGLRQGLRNVWAAPKWYLTYRARNYPYLFLYNYGRVLGINEQIGELVTRRDRLRLGVILALLIPFTLIPLLLGVGGLARARGSLIAVFCAAVWVYTALVHLFLWAEARYWMPAVPFVLVSAVSGCQLLVHRFAHRRSPPRSAGVLLAPGTAAVAQPVLTDEEHLCGEAAVH